jgi:hypothetical protein
VRRPQGFLASFEFDGRPPSPAQDPILGVGGSEVANRIAARSAAEQDAFVLTHRLPVAREVVLPRPELGRELDVVPTGLWRWGSGFQGFGS